MGEDRAAKRAAARPALLLIGLACLGLVTLLYHRALGFGLVGDDAGFIHPPQNWLETLFRPSGEWHFYPLNTLVFAAVGMLTGHQPGPLHFLNFLLHAGVGVALAAWLARFGLNAWTRLFVALFFVSRGVHYEVVAWITELSYLSVALYTIAALACWDRYLRGHSRVFLAGVAVAFACAIFTIEHGLLIAPICLAYDALLRPAAESGSRDPGLRPRWTRLGWRTLAVDSLKYAPLVLVAVAFLAIKQSQHVGLTWTMASVGAAPPPVPSGMEVTLLLPPERTWMGFLNTPLRAYRDLLAATSYHFLPTSLAWGPDDGLLPRHPWLFAIPWLGAQALLLWKGSPLARFLLIWFYVYEAPLAAASVPAARYHYMAGMPAAALVGLGIEWVFRRFAGTRWRPALVPGLAALFALVTFGESRFIGARMNEWKSASDLVNATVAEVENRLPAGPRDLYLVNLPRCVPTAFWPAYTFKNLAEHMPLLFRRQRREVHTYVVYDRSFVDERWPTIGRYMPRDSIQLEAAKPGSSVFEFVGPPPRVVLLD